MGRGSAPTPGGQASAKLTLAERREASVKLSVKGWSYERIYREGGLGHNNAQAVYRDLKAALAQRVARQDLAVDEWREKELALIDVALAKANEILDAVHLAVAGGKVVRDEETDADGNVTRSEPIIDHGPNLAAAQALIRMSESRRKLLGTDAPAKTEVAVDQTIKYVVEATAEELEQL